MLKTIRLPSLVSAVTLAVWLVTPAMMSSNQAAAQGIRIQFGSNPSGYYNGYGSGYYGYGSGYGIGYASPYTSYGYGSGYTGYGYGVYGHRSAGLYTYPRTNIYGYGYGTPSYLYSPSIQFQGRAFGPNYNHFGGYNSYYPYGFRNH